VLARGRHTTSEIPVSASASTLEAVASSRGCRGAISCSVYAKSSTRNAYGVYFIFKSMEQGPTFRVSVPKYPTKDPNHRILARQRSRFTHDYFYIRDEVLGPMVMPNQHHPRISDESVDAHRLMLKFQIFLASL
jgi:hypothetical protein